MLNVRKLKDELNVFSGILSSYTYISVFAAIILLQVHCHAAPAQLRRRTLFFCITLSSWTTLFGKADGHQLGLEESVVWLPCMVQCQSAEAGGAAGGHHANAGAVHLPLRAADRLRVAVRRARWRRVAAGRLCHQAADQVHPGAAQQ